MIRALMAAEIEHADESLAPRSRPEDTRLASDGDAEGGPSRVYRLNRSEELRSGIRRVAAGRADSALDYLHDGGGVGTAEAVHEARKDLKKLRSLLRLVREELGEEAYRRENDRFRDVGRRLAAARDAEVKLQTLGALGERYADEMPEEIDGLEQALAAERDEATTEIERDDEDSPRARAALEIEAGRAAVEAWPLDTDGWEAIAPGLRRSYRRGRRRFADVRAEPTDENVHEWRKRVKDLWYHLRLVEDAWPDLLGETADQAHALADLLGDHHDLAVLAEDVRGRGGVVPAAALGRLEDLIARRQDELLADAIPRARRIYAEKPKRLVGRLESYWTAWRGA